MSLAHLPPEIMYLIFGYLHKADLAYAFLESSDHLSSAAKYYLGKEIRLTDIANRSIFDYCLSAVLPSLGSNLRRLTIGRPYRLHTYLESVTLFCPNLEILDVHCCSHLEDIRHYASYLIHPRLKSLALLLNGQNVDNSVALRLLARCEDELHSPARLLVPSLRLHLSSANDLLLLERFACSDYLSDGYYQLECVDTGRWLTASIDDLCLMSSNVQWENVFRIQQINNSQCCLEYEFFHAKTQRRLTVLIPDEAEERWPSSSILSMRRDESPRSCATFTFERADDEQFYIRPCYSRAKRLQMGEKRIIISMCDNQSTQNHRFKLRRIAQELSAESIGISQSRIR